MDAKANLFFSCYDCLNYLDNEDDLFKTFEAVYSHLSNGGLFIFDLNNLNRFENYYGDNVFVFKQNNAVLLWENHYNPQTQSLRFEIECFVKQDKLYKRQAENHKQKYFSKEAVSQMLSKLGFEIAALTDDPFVFNSKNEPVRDFYVALKK